MENLSEYFQLRTGERSNRAIASNIGIDASTVNRQLSGITTLTVETVVAICRRYGLDFADAFVTAGFLTQEEAESFADSHALSRISDLDLSREIVRRLEAGQAGPALTEPLELNPVIQFPATVGGEREDLDAVARPTDPDSGEDR